MKLMMFVELGSTGRVEMSVFQRLADGKGTNPFRLVSCPAVIPLHVPACPRAATENNDTTATATATIALRITAPREREPHSLARHNDSPSAGGESSRTPLNEEPSRLAMTKCSGLKPRK